MDPAAMIRVFCGSFNRPVSQMDCGARGLVRCSATPTGRPDPRSIEPACSLQMLRFSKQVVRRRSMMDGSMGYDIPVAADAGKLPLSECSALMVDYLVPSSPWCGDPRLALPTQRTGAPR
jgi:hypothetical protein